MSKVIFKVEQHCNAFNSDIRMPFLKVSCGWSPSKENYSNCFVLFARPRFYLNFEIFEAML